MMLFGRSITAWLVRILVLLKILPRGKSKLEDWCGFLFWLITQLAVTGVWIYQMGDRTGARVEKVSLAGLIQLVSVFINPIFHNIGIAWTLTKPWHKYDITNRRNLKAPETLPLLIVIAAIQLFHVYLYLQTYRKRLILQIISMAILSLLSVLIIGILVSQAPIDDQEPIFDSRSAIQVAQLEISNLRDLKDFLSPLLFVVLTSNGIITLASSYKTLINSKPLMSPWMVYVSTAILTIIYTCVTVNKCCLRYNSKILSLR